MGHPVTVYTWSDRGRYHRDADCAYRGKVRGKPRERTREAAEAGRWWPCPYCWPQRVPGRGSQSLPRLAAGELPEWEDAHG
jgi:hypothetical protein